MVVRCTEEGKAWHNMGEVTIRGEVWYREAVGEGRVNKTYGKRSHSHTISELREVGG